MPGLAGTGLEKAAQGRLRVPARHVAADRHRRRRLHHQRVPEAHSFVEALKEEWRDIIATKSALFAYTQIERPTHEQYIATFCKLSETIDNMRSVYQNVGETDDLIGLYPYAPLHDMRRALQTLDPRKTRRARCRGAQPRARRHPAVVLRAARDVPGGAGPRGAGPPAADLGRAPRQEGGSTGWARRAQERQRARQDRTPSPDPRIDEMLAELYDKENPTAKPWRQPGRECPRRLPPTAAVAKVHRSPASARHKSVNWLAKPTSLSSAAQLLSFAAAQRSLSSIMNVFLRPALVRENAALDTAYDQWRWCIFRDEFSMTQLGAFVPLAVLRRNKFPNCCQVTRRSRLISVR